MLRNILLSTILLASACSCSASYKTDSISAKHILVDSSWDNQTDAKVNELINSYKIQIDAVMNQKIGTAPVTMTSGKPQSLLSNYAADVLRKTGEEFIKAPVELAVMNNGGLRSSINAGDVSVGDIFKVFPFENELVILQLKGSDVKALFSSLAGKGGEGLSGCKFVISKNKVKTLLVAGKPVEDDRIYNIATLDYLAEGNSGMTAFCNAIARTDTKILIRDMILDYIKKNPQLSSQIDDRTVIEK